MITALILLWISSLLRVQSSQYLVPKYYDVSVGKCDGSFSAIDGQSTFNISSPEFIVEIRDKTKTQCRWICSRDVVDCVMIEYGRNRCRLFRKVSFVTILGSQGIDEWVCNDDTCVEIDNRCPGYWVGYDRYQITDRNHFPLITYRDILLFECHNYCQHCPMCGSINFNCTDTICAYIRGNCTLLYGFAPSLTSIEAPNNSTDVITWRCCLGHNFQDNSYRERQIGIESIKNVCGQWKIQSKNDSNLQSYSFYSQIYSLSSKTCIDICSKTPYCIQPVYLNSPIPLCYLALLKDIGNAEEKETLADKVKNKDFEIWKWEEAGCKNKKSDTDLNSLKNCTCFRKGNSITIYNDICRQYIDVFNEGSLSLYEINDHFSDGRNLYKIVPNNKHMYRCDWFNCKLHHAMIYNGYKNPNIITRQQWFAREPLSSNRLVHPVKAVFVLNTFYPHGRCFTFESCSSFVRDFQRFQINYNRYDDIAYNFLIGEDGNVYEGRGWNHSGAHTKGYNTRSIGVAFIGWFETVNPTLKSLLILRDLVSNGINRGYLSKDVVIKNHRDVRPSKIPGAVLMKIIDNFVAANLSPSEDCEQYRLIFPEYAKYLISITFLIVLTGIVYCLIKCSYHRMQCCRNIMEQVNLEESEPQCVYDDVTHDCLPKIGLKKDWVYYIEDRQSYRIKCRCKFQVHLLWYYCLIANEKSFINHFNLLFRTLHCPKKTVVFVVGSDKVFQSKHIFIFHASEERSNWSEKLFNTVRTRNCCVCKEFVITQYPHVTHRHFDRFYGSFMKNMSFKLIGDNWNETVNQALEGVYRLKSCSFLKSKGCVKFSDVS